jgi:hypothetical protein
MIKLMPAAEAPRREAELIVSEYARLWKLAPIRWLVLQAIK